MKTTTAERDPQSVTKLRDLIDEIGVAMLTTVTPDGVLRSRPLRTQHTEAEGELWFFISDQSGIAEDVAEEPGVNVSYSKPESEHYVSVSGQATLVTDASEMEKLWAPALVRYFPDGLDDPHLALLRVRIETAEYWDEAASEQVGSGATKGESAAQGNDPDADDDHTKVEIRATRASG